jgi:hypothetical protein
MQRPIHVPRWAILALLFGVYLTVRGYHSRDGDQAYRLPLLLHQQDPSRFADDPFVLALDDFNPHRGYLALLDLASRPLGLSFALFGLFTLTFFLTCHGIDRLARSLWPGRAPGVGWIAVGLVLLAKAGNIGTNHLFEAMLLDRLIGFGLGWVAIALAVEGETWRPSLLIGLAAVVHPSVGLQLTGLLGATWIAWAIASPRTGQTWRSTALGLLTLTIAVVPGTIGTVMQGGQLFQGLSAEEFRLLGVELQMAQHMVPTLWRKPQWLAWAAFVVLGILSLARPEIDRRATGSYVRTRFAILFGVLLAGLGVAYVAIEVVGSLKVTVFQPFRMATIARGLALIAVACRCHRLWARGRLTDRARVLLLAAGLGGDWAFVVATAVELVATFADWISENVCLGSSGASPQRERDNLGAGGSLRSTPGTRKDDDSNRLRVERGPHSGPYGSRPATLILVVFAIVWGCVFLAKHDTEQGQWSLLTALILATASLLLARRPRLVWTRRRLAIAMLVAWCVPIAAMAASTVGKPSSRLVQALATRCRFVAIPTDDIERLAVWSRDHTPTTARFITPPGPKTFRLWSERSVAFNRAASPYHAGGLVDWSDRFRAHVGFAGTTADFVHAYLADRHGVESRYGRLSPEELAALALSQGADYVVSAALPTSEDDRERGLRVLKVEGRYAVYRVVAEAKVARR